MNQVILVGQVEGGYEIIFDKKEVDRKLMKFMLKVQKPFKNRDGNYDEDTIRVKVWTNNIDNLDLSLKDKAIIGIKGRIQSYPYINDDGEELFANDIVADRITYLSSLN